jgi:hypothetical protein
VVNAPFFRQKRGLKLEPRRVTQRVVGAARRGSTRFDSARPVRSGKAAGQRAVDQHLAKSTHPDSPARASSAHTQTQSKAAFAFCMLGPARSRCHHPSIAPPISHPPLFAISTIRIASLFSSHAHLAILASIPSPEALATQRNATQRNTTHSSKATTLQLLPSIPWRIVTGQSIRIHRL